MLYNYNDNIKTRPDWSEQKKFLRVTKELHWILRLQATPFAQDDATN